MGKGFRCKQFSVAQDNCAMKVNTDSLLLGSWVQAEQASRIADIGTGTGILALMLAQKALPHASITAVELDTQAALQAHENFQASPWPSKIHLTVGDVLTLPFEEPFDLIVTNPPYFAGAQGATNAYDTLSASRERARIADQLSPERLFQWVACQLTDNGSFYCVYPAAMEDAILSVANKEKLILKQCLYVQSTPNHTPYLVAYCFGKYEVCTENAQLASTIVIRDENGNYSSDYRHLCQAYYLHF